MLLPRFKAFLIHFSFSCIMAGLVVFWVFGVWYPAPLDKAIGVAEVFWMLLGVDVVLGPCLTFVVFDRRKKSLRFDIATIALLQFAAFAYGVYTVAGGRPAWLAFSVDRFDLVQAYQIDERKVDLAEEEFRSPPWLGPKWVAAHRATDRKERQQILFESLFKGIDISQHPELFRSLDTAAQEIREKSLPLDELKKYNTQEAVEQALAKWPEADAYLPLMARIRSMTVLINKASAKVVAIVDLNPWP